MNGTSVGHVKVAVELKAANITDLFTLYDETPLQTFIAQLCEKFNIQVPPSDHQLQFDHVKLKAPPVFITEENRHLIRDGHVLLLDLSGEKYVGKIIADLQESERPNLKKLNEFVLDPEFAKAMLAKGGLQELLRFITHIHENDRITPIGGQALSSFVSLMEQAPAKQWALLDSNFLRVIIGFILARPGTGPNADALKAKHSAMVILEGAIDSNTDSVSLIASLDLDVDAVIYNIRLQDQTQELQSKCISLINTVLRVSDMHKRRQIRNCIFSSEIRNIFKEQIFTRPVQPELEYQLYCLQTRLFNVLQERLFKAVDHADEEADATIRNLWSTAFASIGTTPPGAARRANETRDLSKLGFKHQMDPMKDFGEVPPGQLGLDCIRYFSENYNTHYVQIVLENSRERAESQGCPFIHSSCELVNLLAKVCHIGEQPLVEGSPEAKCLPMFFSSEHPFEELFSLCIMRLTKTWKEMKATIMDMNKVLEVVREQITKALAERPHTFDSLKHKLNRLSFNQIQEERQREVERREELKTQTKPIKELKDMIRPEIYEVIRQQRINRMIEGFHFYGKARRTGAKEYMYCKLSHNAKMLQYKVTNDKQTVPTDLQSINVRGITEIATTTTDGRNQYQSIIIRHQQDGDLNLICPDEQVYYTWLDGLNAVSERGMTSAQFSKDMEELLTMEVKLRLLDAEGLSFPEDPPPIPPLPAQFTFSVA